MTNKKSKRMGFNNYYFPNFYISFKELESEGAAANMPMLCFIKSSKLLSEKVSSIFMVSFSLDEDLLF